MKLDKETVELMLTHSRFNNVRKETVEGGEEWYFATDLAEAIGYIAPRGAILRYCVSAKKSQEGKTINPSKLIGIDDVQRLFNGAMSKNVRKILKEIREDLEGEQPVKSEKEKVGYDCQTTTLSVFSHEVFGDLRVTDTDGNPWFVAKDVCDILELSNTSKAVSILDDDEKTTITISDSGGRPYKLLIISESGLYDLLMKSRKQMAKEFSRWVRKVVLPSIRKTGSYTTQSEPEQKHVDKEEKPKFGDHFFKHALESFKESTALLVEFGWNETDAKLKAIEALKLHYGIDLTEYTGGTALIKNKSAAKRNNGTGREMHGARELAKLIDWKEYEVNQELKRFKMLRREAYLGKNGVKKFRWRLTSKGKSYGEEFPIGKKHSDGTDIVMIKWYPEVLNVIAEYEAEHSNV